MASRKRVADGARLCGVEELDIDHRRCVFYDPICSRKKRHGTPHAGKRGAGCVSSRVRYIVALKRFMQKDACRNELVPMRLHAEMLTDPSEAGDACVTLLLIGAAVQHNAHTRLGRNSARWNTSPNTIHGKASRRRRRRRRVELF